MAAKQISQKNKIKPVAAFKGTEFVRATVTIPGELSSFADKRANEPQHAGNFSSYIRSLIIRDKQTA